MNATQIIDEIVALPPDEQAKVIRFVGAFSNSKLLNGRELTALAQQMIDSNDPDRKAEIRAAIKSGFYGSKPHA